MNSQPTYVLIPGAASDAWYWHLVVPELRSRGGDVVAVDLPCEDDSAGLAEYADAVVEAIGDRTNLVVVAHSFGGFTAPLVCERMPVDVFVLVQAMIPAPGEPPGEWWTNTGYEDEVSTDVSAFDTFFNDVAPDLAAEAMRREMAQSETPMVAPWPLDEWPDVPTRFLLCSEDRFFPAPFMRRVVRERLGIEPDEIATGHMPMLARPQELAERLYGYAAPGS
jgi:pimeloyl-ACP methyl ester carboxylesterase